MNRVTKLTIITVSLLLVTSTPLLALESKGIDRGDKKAKKDERFLFDINLDAYYTSAGLLVSLTDKPVPYVGEQSELELYKSLFQSSLLPRFLLFEASVNPMPYLGVALKQDNKTIYDQGEIANDLNLIKAMTAGFDEPYALSVFMGNVANYAKPGKANSSGNKGYMGYLLSGGDYHIKDNELIDDNWYEVEWKIKGDREYATQNLNWSFRVGAKIHSHPEINDLYYMSFRRNRVDYKAKASSLLKNSGFEYTLYMDRKRLSPISLKVVLEKNWPVKSKKFAFSLKTGFIWESNDKYSGSLQNKGVRNFQLVILPNIQF